MKWYYALNNQRQGPVSESEFDFLVHQKKILPDTLVWNETMTDWRPLREVQPEPAAAPLPPAGEMALPAAQPVMPERYGPAWEERDRIGGINAAARTVFELLGNSNRTFARMKYVADWAGPYCFAFFIEGLVYCINLTYAIITSRLNPGSLKGFAFLFTSNYASMFIVIFVYFFLPFFIAFVVIFNSVLIHLCLMLTGGARQPFQATYRVVCYSFGASAAWQFIPRVGFLLSIVWNLILMIRGIAKLHEISTARAIFALMPVALCTAWFVLVGLGMI